MYELVTASQTNRWQQILDIFNITDIYYSSEYFSSALKLDPGEVILFYFVDEAGEGAVAYPFIKRQQSEEGMLYHDITSPFGYGGPVPKVNGDSDKLAANFLKDFAKYCYEEKIFEEFVRFHPLLNNADFLKNRMDLIAICETYTFPLQKDLLKNELESEDYASEFEIKKLGTVTHMFDFLVLYYSSARLNEETDSYYFFTNDYFESMVSDLGSNLQLFGAYKDNELVAACYLLTKDDVIYHHLSGKEVGNVALEAEKELIRSVALWGSENNYLFYHLTSKQLGALLPSKAISLFPCVVTSSTFYISRLVHDREVYKVFHPLEAADLIKRYGNI